MNGMAKRALTALAVAAVTLVAAGSAAVAGSVKIQPSRLSRLYNLQFDGQDLRRVWSNGGVAGYWHPLDIPVGSKITGLSSVHECWGISSACRTSTAIWRVKADAAIPLQLLYEAPYAGYDVGLWVEGAAVPGADLVVRSGWRYFVGAACLDETAMVGEIVVTWK